MAVGMYDPDAPQAIDLNPDTVMMWNAYVARITHESARLRHRRKLRENPDMAEAESDALNVALVELSDPKLRSGALRVASVPVPTRLIAEIPFRNATERVILMLDELRGAIRPEVFNGEGFVGYKTVFDDLVRQLRKEAAEGELSPDTLRLTRLSFATERPRSVGGRPARA
jgi:hypothetical protein